MRVRAQVGIVAFGLILTGCSGSAPPAAAPQSIAPSAPVTTTPEAAKPAPVKLGEPFAIYDGGTEVATVTFTSVELDPSCAPSSVHPSEPSAGHHLVGVFADITTGAGVMANGIPAMTDGDFAEMTPEGYTNTSLSPGGYGTLCLDDRPHVGTNYYSPNSKYKDVVPVETQGTSGMLIYQPQSSQAHSIAFPQKATSPTTAPPTSTTAAAPTTQYVPPTTLKAPATTTTRSTPTQSSCPPGTVFSPLGPNPCVSPQQKAQTENGEAQCGGGSGPVSVCGPKPTYVPVPSGQPDNRPGYSRCGVRCGEAPTSGDIQGQYAKQQCAAGVKSYC